MTSMTNSGFAVPPEWKRHSCSANSRLRAPDGSEYRYFRKSGSKLGCHRSSTESPKTAYKNGSRIQTNTFDHLCFSCSVNNPILSNFRVWDLEPFLFDRFGDSETTAWWSKAELPPFCRWLVLSSQWKPRKSVQNESPRSCEANHTTAHPSATFLMKRLRTAALDQRFMAFNDCKTTRCSLARPVAPPNARKHLPVPYLNWLIFINYINQIQLTGVWCAGLHTVWWVGFHLQWDDTPVFYRW